jgi:hypothetical protein
MRSGPERARPQTLTTGVARRSGCLLRKTGRLWDRARMADEPPQQQIELQIDPHQAAGVYSNLMMISHRKEEFVLDFLFLQPQQLPQGRSAATLRARVITSPEHAKRILRALQENLRRYEDSFGVIEEASDLPKITH